MPQTKERHTEYMCDYRKRKKETIIELKRFASQIGSFGKYTLLVSDLDNCVVKNQNKANPKAFCAWMFKRTVDALGEVAEKIEEL